jgi:hypothetical protein
VTFADLKAFVGSSASDDLFVQACWNTALELVTNFVGTNTIPTAVLDRATLMCGSELFHARQAPNGIAQFNGFDGQPVRIARDPMTPAYSLLGQYMVTGL